MPNVMNMFGWHWMVAAGRLIWGCIALAICLAIVFAVFRRPKPDREVTWAEAMGGSVFLFGVFLLAYAVIPSEFITFSDKYLQWGTDKYVFKSTTQFPLNHHWNWPFSFTGKAFSDILVVVIYSIFFGFNLLMFSLWQKRPTAAEAAERPARRSGTSRFGRPLKAKA